MKKLKLFSVLLVTLSLTSCNVSIQLDSQQDTTSSAPVSVSSATSITLSEIPEYNGEPYYIVNNNVPFFSENTTEVFEIYSDLDDLKRCGVAYANICKELMPTDSRENIGSVKPSGWQSAKYDNIEGKYLYNRCHLIGFQLAGENANKKNLITGTRYLNISGMLPFENMVADYVDETDNHVLYRVTPMFEGNDLVAKGVLMEGKSVEDNGDGVEFNIFCYNVQPGITIDYATGESKLADSDNNSGDTDSSVSYVLNTNTKKFHTPECSSAENIKDEVKAYSSASRDSLIEDGYEPCKRCNP